MNVSPSPHFQSAGKSAISLLICLHILPIIESGVFMSSTIIVYFSLQFSPKTYSSISALDLTSLKPLIIPTFSCPFSFSLFDIPMNI